LLLLFIAAIPGCWNDPGEIFGPNTAVVTVVVTKLIKGDTFTVYVNGRFPDKVFLQDRREWVEVKDYPGTEKLTDAAPTRQYRVRIQARKTSYNDYEYGEAFVSVWSANLGKMSRVKSQWAYTDRIVQFEFGVDDFYDFWR
jgi:hypothetical protein